MVVVVQRVSEARVTIDGEIIGRIGIGLLLYVGVEKGDGDREVDYMAEKVAHLRIFPDEGGRMNRHIQEVEGAAILSVSQFTLTSQIDRGRRPDFQRAEDPTLAEKLFCRLNRVLASYVPLESGVFGADMEVISTNSGPVTFIVKKQFSY